MRISAVHLGSARSTNSSGNITSYSQGLDAKLQLLRSTLEIDPGRIGEDDLTDLGLKELAAELSLSNMGRRDLTALIGQCHGTRLVAQRAVPTYEHSW
jgi:hypothetical protein